ncbi:unnamed protein product [Danaus chrysippus]|uniref:(African queen) hypothetical protein n=1 Tax=Danaus chrysippus TaxID=151541 RepID=A0A8J2QSU5_9NEOP|nr:unnamed protein product [Danaus chrysippus]
MIRSCLDDPRAIIKTLLAHRSSASSLIIKKTWWPHVVTTVHLRTRIMRSTAGGRWWPWEPRVGTRSHGSLIHRATPAPLNGDAAHTTDTRKPRLDVCVCA